MSSPSLTIRPAQAGDEGLVARLAALDAAPAPTGSVLLAELDGIPVAAASVHDGRVVADPFVASAAAAALLRIRAKQLRVAERASLAASTSRRLRLGQTA